MSARLTILLAAAIMLIGAGLVPLLGIYSGLLGVLVGGAILSYVWLGVREESDETMFFGDLAKNRQSQRQASFDHVRDTLGRFLIEADELMNRSVKDQAAYEGWKVDLNDWFQSCNRFLSEEISVTDAAIFRDLSKGGRYAVRGIFNAEHADYLNALRKYTENLKEITSRYLARA